MEALILMLIDAVAALFAPLLTAVAAALASLAAVPLALLSLLLELLLHRLFAISRPPSGPAPGAPEPPAARRRAWAAWSRRLLIASAGASMLLLLALMAVDRWFLGDLARALLERQRQRTGLVIAASEIGGSLFSGRFHAHGIVLTRSGHGASDLALTVRSAEVAAPLWRLLAPTLLIDELHATGIRGSIIRGNSSPAPSAPVGDGAADGPSADDADGREGAPPSGRRAQRSWTIAQLEASDVDITYADRTRLHPLVLRVTVAMLSVQPLRGRHAACDLLFRANAHGTIAGRPFRIATAGGDPGRTTDWQADGLPVALLASWIGGPFTLLQGGSCDVAVHDHWRNAADGERMIVMDWSLVLDHVTAALPAQLPPLLAELGKPAVAWLNGAGQRIPLSFTAEIAEERFTGSASAQAAGLWQVVADAAALTIAKRIGLDPERVKDLERTVAEQARAALERWRRRRTP